MLGQAVAKALGDKQGITRYADVHLPMDETLTRVALDVSGRPYLIWKVDFSQPKIGEMDTELFREFFQAFAQNAGITLHIENLYGDNNHHIAETCFKGVARALRGSRRARSAPGGPRSVDQRDAGLMLERSSPGRRAWRPIRSTSRREARVEGTNGPKASSSFATASRGCAAIFGPFYLLFRGEWRALAIYVVVADGCWPRVLQALGAKPDWIGWAMLLLNIVVGLEMSELQPLVALARRLA